MPINNINKIIGVTFYSLAQYVGEYLRQHQPELARNKIDTQAALEESILQWYNQLLSRDLLKNCSKMAKPLGI